ncbi:MAG TPA: AI-2E family transporter, partial [Chloroflexota bacterium]|nr:AI-2E family transporter [Chloroflexota bacterium]
MTGNDRWIRALIILCVLLLAAGLLFAVWLIGSAFSDIVLLFFLAWVLALTIEPSAGVIVKYLRIPLPVAVSLSFLGVLLLIVVGALVVTPLLVAQVIQIIQYLPVLAAELNLRLLALYAELEARGVHVDLESAVGTYDVAGRLQAVIPIILSNIVGAASSIANVF